MLEITTLTHVDHSLTDAHLEYIKGRFKDKDGFFIETVALPDHLPLLLQALYGPSVGDPPVDEADVKYVIRGARKCTSRVVNLPKRHTQVLTVIAGPHEGRPCVLYTAYGGPSAPREPGDTSIATWEEVVASRDFWATHALAAEPTRMWIREKEDVDVFIDRCAKSANIETASPKQLLMVVKHELLHAIREHAPGMAMKLE